MSKVANEKRNWLEEVKADAEAVTRARLLVDLPKVEQEVAEREAKKKEARRAGVEFADVPPTQPVSSDGQPDQGEMRDAGSSDPAAESEEVKRLKAELKAVKTKNTRLENKLKSDEEGAEESAQPDEQGEGQPEGDQSGDEQKEGKK